MLNKSLVTVLRVRATDKDIFLAIRSGKKKIETRAATKRYQKIQKGDWLEFRCGKLKSRKSIAKTRLFKSTSALLRIYPACAINPFVRTAAELKKMYYSYPKYREKIKKYGLIAFELK